MNDRTRLRTWKKIEDFLALFDIFWHYNDVGFDVDVTRIKFSHTVQIDLRKSNNVHKFLHYMEKKTSQNKFLNISIHLSFKFCK